MNLDLVCGSCNMFGVNTIGLVVRNRWFMFTGGKYMLSCEHQKNVALEFTVGRRCNPMVIRGLKLIQELQPKQRHWGLEGAMRANHPGEILKNSGCPVPLRVFCSCFAEGSLVLHMHVCEHCGLFLWLTCHHVFSVDAEICSSTGSSTPFAPQTSSLIYHILSQITATRTVGPVT